jgi:hypothetical protein
MKFLTQSLFVLSFAAMLPISAIASTTMHRDQQRRQAGGDLSAGRARLPHRAALHAGR